MDFLINFLVVFYGFSAVILTYLPTLEGEKNTFYLQAKTRFYGKFDNNFPNMILKRNERTWVHISNIYIYKHIHEVECTITGTRTFEVVSTLYFLRFLITNFSQ